MADDADDQSPGWEAIDRALEPIYRGREPLHYATIIKWRLGGPDPLDGVSAYKRTEPRPHWHFVTYGFTELYEKESQDPAVSGYGFELTFRLACADGDEAPPVWPMSLLQNLARYVFQTGNVFAAGHHLSLNGPIALDESTDITAVLFVADPEVPAAQSPNGSLDFLQLVGITDDELQAAASWNSERFAELMARANPLLVTELSRRSILSDPEAARAVAEGIERDGSSLAELMVSTVRSQRAESGTRLTIDALGVSGFIKQLRGRTLHGRPFYLIGLGDAPENMAAFVPSEVARVGTAAQGGHLEVGLSRAAAIEMSDTLRAERGIYRWDALERFEIEVVPIDIKDRDGNVTSTVG
jgi:suppressor of fused